MSDRALNAEQLQAITHGNGPLLIIAGAGTGKTTVITERIKHLINEKGIDPSAILALTFTDKAANEMETRIDEALPLGYTQMWVTTFHGFCDRILRENGFHIGLSSQIKLMTQAESVDFLRRNLFELQLEYFLPLGNPTKFLFGLLNHFSRLQDEDISPKEYLSWAMKKELSDDSPAAEKMDTMKWNELARSYQKYIELKDKAGVLDFGDLIAKTLTLFRERPNILAEYHNRFSHVLVDEFQDTNLSQYELVKLLCSGNKNTNITVVGDDSQSIYRFRGAAISNIISFKNDFPSAASVVLLKNYRSYQEILDASYRLIQHNNPDTLESQLGISKNLVSVRGNSQTKNTEYCLFDRVEDEADGVISTISNFVTNGTYEWKDFAILVRANSHADPFVRSLEMAGIPYQFLGPGKLFQQDEVLDFIAYLKVLNNVDDSQSFFRLLSVPFFKIVPRDIAKLGAWAHKNTKSLFDACEHIEEIDVSDETKTAVAKILGIINTHLGQTRDHSAGQLLYSFFEETGLVTDLLSSQTLEGVAKAENISKFFTKIKAFESVNKESHVQNVLSWLDLQTDLGESPQAAEVDWSDNNAVNILTVHSSKGLEFPVVFLVNLVSLRFPGMERHEQIPIPDALIKEMLPTGDFHLQEERRLAYVGMTRAKDYLYLTAAKFYGDAKREKKVSPFIFEAFGEDILPRPVDKKDGAFLNKQTTPLETKKTKTSISYLSYSQIETFKICPLHYRLRYILKVPSDVSPAQSLGNSLHRALKLFYEQEKTKTKESLSVLINSTWISEGYENKTHEAASLKKAQAFLDFFYDEWFDNKSHTVAVETPFQFKIQDLKVGGIIDRIDQEGEILHIIDYKTGGTPLTQKEADKNLQLSIYALAASEIKQKPFGVRPDKIKLSLYYFETKSVVSTYRTLKQLNEAKEEILEWRKHIEDSDFCCSGNFLCQNCEYRAFCKSSLEKSASVR